MYNFVDKYIEPKIKKIINELNLEAPEELVKE